MAKLGKQSTNVRESKRNTDYHASNACHTSTLGGLSKRRLAFEAQGHRAPHGVTATPGKLQDSDLYVK